MTNSRPLDQLTEHFDARCLFETSPFRSSVIHGIELLIYAVIAAQYAAATRTCNIEITRHVSIIETKI